MSKESYYFTHDYNARHDKKISALVREFKSAGYGIFWCAAEMLHEEGGKMELDELTLSAISNDLNEDFDLVKKVIEKCVSTFKLFHILEGNILTGNRVNCNLNKRKEISKVRSESGTKGAIAKQLQANAEQKDAKERKGKERKRKEIKGKENDFIQMPLAVHFNGLPEMKVKAVIQLLKITKDANVSDGDVTGLWEVFKIQNLNGTKFYQNEDAVYSHFINWSKSQKESDWKGKGVSTGINHYQNEIEQKRKNFKSSVPEHER